MCDSLLSLTLTHIWKVVKQPSDVKITFYRERVQEYRKMYYQTICHSRKSQLECKLYALLWGNCYCWFTCSQKWKSDGSEFHWLCLFQALDDAFLPVLGRRTVSLVGRRSCQVYNALARQVTCWRHCNAVRCFTCSSHSNASRIHDDNSPGFTTCKLRLK